MEIEKEIDNNRYSFSHSSRELTAQNNSKLSLPFLHTVKCCARATGVQGINEHSPEPYVELVVAMV